MAVIKVRNAANTDWIEIASVLYADTVVPETSFGLSAIVGTDDLAARRDHSHGSPTHDLAVHTALGLFDQSSDVDHDATTNFLANEHIDHTVVVLTAGVGLSGGGDISASRTFTIDLNELTAETTIDAGDFLAMVDITDSGSGKITFANLEATINHANLVNTHNLTTDIDHDTLTNFLAAEHVDWAGAAAGTIHTDNYIKGGAGTDTTAIHDNVASEISAITEKATPVNADMVIIEDSADSNNKKMVQVGNLPSSSGTDRVWLITGDNDTTITTSRILPVANVTTGSINTDMGFQAVRAGSITGIAVNTYVTTANDGSNQRWHVYKNGASVFYVDIATGSADNATYMKATSTQAAGIDTFVAGDIFYVYYEEQAGVMSLAKAIVTFELTLN